MSDVPLDPTPGFLVWRLSMKWRVAVDRALAPLGLTHAQYSLVASLRDMRQAGRKPTQRELADHTGLEALYVSKLARSLEAAGLVERTRDPIDTRAVRLALTDHGMELAVQAIDLAHERFEALLAPLGGPDADRTRQFTRELAQLLEVPVE
ncbi:MAG: MarR family transcriptional regulator [Streptomycetaceae bacterium]|jgi:DNA-binding MarR family transcriptional regulator|nr:MarR family transcriptional regulator [Streptomycetaceae bacterium]NUS58438.1 MarR family transcriptional regulator [Streptomycetaceae bacterium]